MKLSAKQSAAIKSYWHAFIAVESAFAIEYAKTYFTAPTGTHSVLPHFNFVTFGYSAIGAVFAPASRALVSKWAWLSPLQVRLTTKLALLQNAATPVVPATPATPADPADPVVPVVPASTPSI